MDITVAICSWNRASSLANTLASCTELRSKNTIDWELIVVDNNSEDETPHVVAAFEDRLPIRYVFEQRQGLSHARNRAVEAAAGDLILWTDDDVLVDPLWLSAYVQAAKRFPEAAFFGGPIEPAFEAPPPPWLRDNLHVLGSALALRNLGADLKPIVSAADLPYGANMAMRRDALRQHLFDPTLGRIGTALLSGEETALFLHLLDVGLTGCWIGGATVHHLVPPERMTLGFIGDYYKGIGRSEMLRIAESKRQRYRRKLKHWRRELLWVKLRLRLAHRRDAAWARNFLEAARLEGQIAALTSKPA